MKVIPEIRGHLNLISTIFLTLNSCLQYACGKTNMNDNFTKIDYNMTRDIEIGRNYSFL